MNREPKNKTAPRPGKFSIQSGRIVDGELCLAGDSTFLTLRDTEDIQLFKSGDDFITGTLADLTKVTLVQCVVASSGSTWSENEMIFHSGVFPHYVIEGHGHLDPNAPTITEIRLVLDDAIALFNDFGIFGEVYDAKPHIEQIIAANGLHHPIVVGPNPKILYFTGKYDIIEIQTAIGTVSAHNNLSGTFPSTRGVRLDNTVSVNITTPGIAFHEVISRALQLIQFLALIIGRPQTLLEMTVTSGASPERFKVHWSFCPTRKLESSDTTGPQPGDLPLDPIRRPDEFSRVISSWFEHNDERRDARNRLQTCFRQQRRYSVDRLVGAANMFDILPPSAVPQDIELAAELRDAKERCRTIFQNLPHSYERDGVLNALGRVGKPSLKHKVRYRASFIADAVGDRFPNLIWVLEQAVDCRNHYVHGASSKIDYSANVDIETFLTDSLEFVFAASELVEAGWDMRAFIETPTSMTHPFGAYRVRYQTRLAALKAAVVND